MKIYHLYLANRELEADGQRTTVRLPPTTPLTAVHCHQQVLYRQATATVDIVRHRVRHVQQLRTSNILNILKNTLLACFLIPYRMTYKDIIQDQLQERLSMTTEHLCRTYD